MVRFVKLFLMILLVATGVAAEEVADAPEEPTPLWSGDLSLSYLATSGNTDTESGGVALELKREARPWGVELEALAQRSEDEGVLTAERYFVSARALRALSERWDLFGGLSWEQDRFSGVDSRFIVSSGGRWKALLGPVHFFDAGLGLTYTDEELTDDLDGDEFLGGVLDLAYKWQISETASFGQTVAYYPNFDESSDWRLESVTSLQAQILARLALKASYEVRYRNAPVLELDDTDTTTRVSVVWTF